MYTLLKNTSCKFKQVMLQIFESNFSHQTFSEACLYIRKTDRNSTKIAENIFKTPFGN